MKRETMNGANTNVMVIITAIVFSVVGCVLLFVPQVELYHVSCFICGMITVAAVYSIVKYFITEGFAEFGNYGFSTGVFLGVIGIIGFVKLHEIVMFFPAAISIIALLMGVIVFQDAMDMKCMTFSLWSAALAASIAIMIFAAIILVNPFTDPALREMLSKVLLVAAGIFQLVSKIMLRVAYKKYIKMASEPQKEAIIVEAAEVSTTEENYKE